MRKSAKDGLDQIVDKNYRSNTASHIQMIVEVAIAFYKKSTVVSARLLRREKVEPSTSHTWKVVSSAESV